MSVQDYEDLSITSAKKPQNNHLWWETDTEGIYLVDSGDNTKIYYSSDKGANWTQVDVDPGDASGDNKSRIQKVQSAWHDKANQKIYFVDCDNGGVGDDFDHWTLDYTASESSPAVVEIGTGGDADVNTMYATDVFLASSKIYVMTHEFDGNDMMRIWEVTSFPFVKRAEISLV